MGEVPLRKPIRALYREVLRRIVYPRGGMTSVGPALVFAPHQDDETLGCGGTILKKRRAGIPVCIVYMTDGSRSTDEVPPAQLRTIRLEEAIAGARVLGVDRSELRFLDFPDCELATHEIEAVRAVRDILEVVRAHEIFIPCPNDKHVDHIATNRIVWSALEALATDVTVYEYPVHFWGHWPLIDSTQRAPMRLKLSILRHGLRSFTYAIRRFNCGTFVGDVLDVKRTSLAQHRSQMIRPAQAARWKTLPEMGNGEWLDLLFQDYELFHRKPYKVATRTVNPFQGKHEPQDPGRERGSSSLAVK